MSPVSQSNLTILFDEPFWIGLYERTDGGRYEVCKITFGAEPKDCEVYEFLLKNWHKLKFSPPIRADATIERKVNPKRRQREIHCLSLYLSLKPSAGPPGNGWYRRSCHEQTNRSGL